MAKRRPRAFGLLLKGASMGAAHVVPGVSGGTMALITGIYEELIEAIGSFNGALLKLLRNGCLVRAYRHIHGPFLAPLGFGIVIAVLTLARLIRNLLENHPVPVWSLFFGLILASVFIVGRRIPRWKASSVVMLLVGGVSAYYLMGMVPVETPESPWFVFLSGAASVIAMILPGISGAHVLLVLGKYRFILDALLGPDLPVLTAFLAGCAAGLLAFSRLLGWLLGRAHDPTMAALMGFMAGSLRRIWPWKETLVSLADRHGQLVPVIQKNVMPAWDSQATWALLTAFLGALFVILIERAARRRR